MAIARTYSSYDYGIHQLFEAQVERTPDAPAVEFTDQRLSYRQLNDRANQVAYLLRAHGIGPEMCVGLCMERSLEQMVGLLGILKAGAAYLPLDPLYPSQRLHFMLTDAQAPLLLTQDHLQNRLSALLPPQLQVICQEQVEYTLSTYPVGNLEHSTCSDQLAYMIYTSGTTGQPKGVLISQRSLVSHCQVIAEQYGLTASDRVLHFASLSFDVAAEELFPTWISGATVVLRPTHLSLADFHHLLEQQRLTLVNLPATYWHEWVKELVQSRDTLPSTLRRVIVGSEKVHAEAFALWQQCVGAKPVWNNAYGPTEATITATIYEPQTNYTPQGELAVPIGQPLSNTEVCLLDARLQPVLAGQTGELYIGGSRLARGYLHHPDLTAQYFVPHPFSTQPGARLYKTGDLARWLPGGALDFLGRVDQQVKLHGYRIELGEIEATLRQHPGVQDALILLKSRSHESAQADLLAYIIPAEAPAPTAQELLGYLKERLPDYMLPSACIFLEAFPLAPNGKVDRQALPAPDRAKFGLTTPFVAPRTPLEELITGIWARALGVEHVGIHDNFFSLGGNSLAALRAIAQIRASCQIELPLSYLFERPTVSDLSEIIETGNAEQSGQHIDSIPRVARDQPLPLSFSQERIWFIQHLYPEILSYNTQTIHRLRGSLDVTALERSINEIARRHEILRTTFPDVQGQPVQLIHAFQPTHLPLIDLQHISASAREQKVQQLVTEEFARPFAITKLPLIRWTLLRLHSQEHILILVEHHLVHDGWSANVLLSELLAHYQAFSAGQPSPLPESSIQFADFASWQRQWLQGDVLETQLHYWTRQLAGIPPEIALPYDRQRAEAQHFRGASPRALLSEEFSEELRAFSRQEGVTLFMTMLAAFAALLARYSGQEDLCIGTGVANRRWHESEGLLGMIINNVVLRADLTRDPTFRQLLKRIRQTTLEAYTYQDLPFDQVVKAVQPVRDLNKNPLFQVMFNFHDPLMPELELPNLSVELEEGLSNGFAKFDLDVLVIPRVEQYLGRESKEKNILLVWEYNADLFDEATMLRMLGHYQQVLRAVVDRPERRLSQLPLLTEAERHQILLAWNATRAEYPASQCIHQLFEAQVERTPAAPAVIFDNQELSYRQLNERANQVAHLLRARGIGPEMCVGLCMERSLAQMVALLGILKAGAAYLPLDPLYPSQRLLFMLSDAQAPLLLTLRHIRERLPADLTQRVQVVCLEQEEPSLAHLSTDNPENYTLPAQLAYVIYTSGSTGNPKGVLIPQRAVVSHSCAFARHCELSSRDRVLHFASLSFDVAAEELFPSWISGAAVVLRPEHLAFSLTDFHHLLEEQRLTLVNLTTPYWHEWVRELDQTSGQVPSTLRRVIVGGEKALPEQLSLWQRIVGDRVQWSNGYGPTETTVTSTIYEPGIDGPWQGTLAVPIGRPLANTQAYLLDAHFQPVPVGLPGELYIGGPRLAQGYLHHPDLTAQHFVPHPFSTEPGARLYRTGDLARWLADGTLDFLGRVDQQVKLRGYRIELGEIEAALEDHPQIREAVVIIHENSPGNARLIAYVLRQFEQEIRLTDLRAFLQKRLPAYMIPAHFVVLGAFPLTISGKVDRKALPIADSVIQEPGRTSEPPRTLLEQTLAAIWSDILEVPQVGLHDNFFELGGHSLLITRVVSRVRDVLQVELPLRAIFDGPTIAELAGIMARKLPEQHKQTSSTITRRKRSSAQDVLTKIDQLSDAEVEALLGNMLATEEAHE
ncbi:MAG TPA: amino acid adenylation domain-containing protein [Ktedonobacteraceae bacterium]|nr:amino acid adenylation domain-containing protein [Ktedonobacteraceae bacterium]